MKHIRILLLLSAMMTVICANAERIGEWRTYMAYGEIKDIEPAGNMIYVLSTNSLFSYNTADESLNTYDKVFPLSDNSIKNIAWNNAVARLIIIYDNYNIDLLDRNDNVVNISDYHNKVMTEDKTVNNIYMNGAHAYVCTNFGILKINMREAEINDTYNLGTAVYRCVISQGKIYAETARGRLAADMTQNILDPTNWKPTADNPSFANDNDITVDYSQGYAEYIATDRQNKCFWSNQKDGRLQSFTIGDDGVTRTVTRSDINPGGPRYNYFGFMTMHQGKLYTCNGKGWDFGEAAAIQIYDTDDDSWTTFDNSDIAARTGAVYQDVMAVAPDPRDPRRVMAGTQSGLYEFYDGSLRNHWNKENSPISQHYNVSESDPNGKNYNVISSLLFDNGGNLWMANSGGRESVLLRLNADGSWTTPSNDIKPDEANMLKIKRFTDNGMLWLYDNSYSIPMLVLYDPATGAKNQYDNFTNEDGMTYHNVSGCSDLAIDRHGNVWTGINHGVFILTPEYISDPEKGFYQIKVPRNDGTNLADYLLSGISITAISIDNAGRKWVGTSSNGIYVISDDNMVEEAHFTTNNSGLISNSILSLLIDNNGKVYIGTDKGLCSYQSEAGQTNESMDKDNVWAYPNPVRPDYSGPITITGLAFNADVKITTSAGTLVAQGRSTGGSFQWDGNDLKGKRVASGIYMVNTATENGGKGTVCKIAVIN